jgi:hypothetical protein
MSANAGSNCLSCLFSASELSFNSIGLMSPGAGMGGANRRAGGSLTGTAFAESCGVSGAAFLLGFLGIMPSFRRRRQWLP